MTERAVLVTVLWDTEEVLHTFFEGPDAAWRADGLREGIKDDFENATHSIVANKQARDAYGDRFVKALFKEEVVPDA